MDPEISRRCSDCGASIRPYGLFCPQCGQEVQKQRDSELGETQALTDNSLTDNPKARSDFESAQTVALDRSDIESAKTVALDRSDIESAKTVAIDRSDIESAKTVALDRSNIESAKTVALDRSDLESAKTVAIDRSDIESAKTVALDRSAVESAHLKSTDHKPRVTAVLGAENVLERVEKLRKVSHVVLDQAAYDPSVRFLLVAAAFLVLFLILVIANKVLG